MKKIILLLILALILRLGISLLGEHGDVINYYYWSKDLLLHGLANFYEREVPNAMHPNYPPLTSYLFWATAVLHEFLWKVFWFLNVKIPAFPSDFIFWWESVRGWYFINKIPGILADLGIISLLYVFGKKLKDEKLGFWMALVFSFNPVFFYNSALWGQTDSLCAFFMLLAFYYLIFNQKISSLLSYLLSFLVKPNMVFALPVFLFYWFKKNSLKKILISLITLTIAMFLLHFPFHPNSGVLVWMADFYKNILAGPLNYLVANSFNLWGFFFGFDNRPDTVLFLGLPAYLIAYLLFSLFTLWLFIFLSRNKSQNKLTPLFAGALMAFAAFLFLPRMHERYFYPVLVLLLPVVAVDKKLRGLYFLLSFIHFVNLYHFWWVPKISFLVTFLSNAYVEKVFILANFACFFWLIKVLLNKQYAQK